MECPKCGNQLKDTAKFCGKCGTKIEQQAAPVANACVECKNELKSGAKFCGKCGTAQPQRQSTDNTPAEQENSTKGFIMWEMQPGQVALKLTEQIFSEYSKAKGVVIPEGYLAMVLCGGKLQTMLDAGVYRFGQKAESNAGVGARIAGFFTGLFSSRSNKSLEQNKKDIEVVAQAVQNRLPVEIVVCRSSNFSLPFSFKKVPTSSIKVDVGLLLSVQVSNLLALYKNHLIDKTVLPAEILATELSVQLEETVHQTLMVLSPEKITLNSELKTTLLEELKALFGSKMPFIECVDLLKISTEREELQRLEQLSEEMYLSERELEQLTRRNEFMNRLTQEQNNAELQNAANTAEFNRQLAQINKDNLLTEEELAIVQREIQERAEDHEFERTRAMDMLVMQHQHDMQSAQIKMEEEQGTRLFNIHMDRQRQTDDYTDERRRKEMDLDKEEQLGQLDILKQAQDIRQQREQAEHDRKMDEKNQDHSNEMEKLDKFSGMSAEQIMVANPNITPEAAKAMAAKFQAEAAEKAADNRAETAQTQMHMMKEFMEQQMQVVRDMSVANQQAMANMAEGKEREIERTQNMMDKNEDRYADVVREQIKAGSKQQGKFCGSCGQEAGEDVFCPECGNRVE